MRGEDVMIVLSFIPSWRITPACAGKTVSAQFWIMVLADHPRMRGEDRRIARGTTPTQGSPPHARGRRRRPLRGRHAGGITPACAGKTEEQET